MQKLKKKHTIFLFFNYLYNFPQCTIYIPSNYNSNVRGEQQAVDQNTIQVGPGGPVVIILATESEVRGFKPGRGRWIFSERKNPEYDCLRKGRKTMGPVS